MAGGEGFEARIGALDPTLFDGVPSLTGEEDRRTLLACQRFTARERPGYRYLEVGSYLGGTLQTHLLDERCAAIHSIDNRPETDAGVARRRRDDPGRNSTERMLELLGEAYPGRLDKLDCIAGDTRTLDTDVIPGPVDLCFIDGEHSDEAIVSDFRFCREVLADSGAIVFHDAPMVYRGLREIIAGLEESGARFHAYNLPTVMFVIEFGDFPIHAEPWVAEQLVDNHRGYLESLMANDYFRRWVETTPLRQTRTAVYHARRSRLARALGIKARM